MKPLNVIKRSIDFGTLRSRENFFSFTLKCLFYIIPAVMIGHYTDITINSIKKHEKLGNYMFYYVLLQTLIIISTLYLLLLLLTSYTSEFQVSIAGSLFIVFYFGVQTNYIHMIKDHTMY